MFDFFWDRVPEDWILSRPALHAFAVSALIITVMTILLIFSPPTDGSLNRLFWGVGGILFGLSIFFLWSGMWRFWSKFDENNKWARRASFLLLLFGIWYGAVLYYISVYLPALRKRINLGKVQL